MTSLSNTQQPTANAVDKICKSLTGDAFKEKLQQALPAGVDVERYSRTAINAIQMHPQKDKFENCDIQTLFLSVQKAATDGLSLDGREATLIAFWNRDKGANDIQYIPMTQGLVKVARNSGEIAAIDPHIVYENDPFSFRPGLDPQPEFAPNWKMPPSQRGEPVLAYCVITLKDGTVIAPEPMHKERILNIGNAGKNGHQYDPKKGPHFAEWWKKTAIKNALKYAPKSSELLNLEKQDNDAQGFDFEKLRDITAAAGTDINELFKPKLVENKDVDEETGEILQALETQPAAEENPASNEEQKINTEEKTTTDSPAFMTLKKELLKAKTIEEAHALKNAPLIGRMKKYEVAQLGKMIEMHVLAIENGDIK